MYVSHDSPPLRGDWADKVRLKMSSSLALIEHIHSFTRPITSTALQAEVRHLLDSEYNDLDVLLGHAGPSTSSSSRPSSGRGHQKRKRTLKEEIGYWEQKEAAAGREVRRATNLLSS